ncbi:hypothetical protein HDV00_003497 [Rhizophlyctis rosea]|nr:hypothetical protein HDV00_003497 [Rhizophlyctis rosea]
MCIAGSWYDAEFNPTGSALGAWVVDKNGIRSAEQNSAGNNIMINGTYDTVTSVANDTKVFLGDNKGNLFVTDSSTFYLTPIRLNFNIDPNDILWDLRYNGTHLLAAYGTQAVVVDLRQGPSPGLAYRMWLNITGQEMRQTTFSPDGSLIFGAFEPGKPAFEIQQWEWDGRSSSRNYTGHTNVVNQIVVSGDGKFFFSSGGDNTIRQWLIQR